MVSIQILYPFLFWLALACFSGVSAQCPAITGIMINSCGGNTTEGQDEFFTFRNGANPLDLSTISVQFPAGGTFCNTGCGGNTWQLPNINTAITVANLSTGCPGLLLEPPGGIIPPNAWVMAFVGANPNFAYNFCGSCNTGPIYVIFTASNSTVGKFSNTQPRTLIINFGTGCIDSAYYDPGFFVPSNVDGNYVMYDPVTGLPTYTTQACPSCIPLPATLTHFQAIAQNNQVEISWQFDSELPIPHMLVVERSINGVDFSPVLSCQFNGAYAQACVDAFQQSGLLYYRMRYQDATGAMVVSEIHKVRLAKFTDSSQRFFEVYPNPGADFLRIEYTGNDDIQAYASVEISDAMGRNIFSGFMHASLLVNTDSWSKGLYWIRFPEVSGEGKVWIKN